MPDDRFILMGRVAAAHGIQGAVKIVSYAESAAVFAPGRPVLLAGTDGTETVYTIQAARPQGRGVVLFLEGVGSRSQAQALAGCDLFIDKAVLPPLEEGTYYWVDLIGLEVYAADGAHLGCLESIFATGSNDVYVVKRAGREILIPALKSVIKAVDLKARRMEVELPEGLP